MAYFTHVGPDSGPLRYCAASRAIQVFESRDDSTRVGMAPPARNDTTGVTLWRLMVHGAELRGL
jgi:hypothetical protein